MRSVVYTEIHKNGKMERWYYGVYSDHNRANDVAYELGHGDGIWHCVCDEADVHELNIKNVPTSVG